MGVGRSHYVRRVAAVIAALGLIAAAAGPAGAGKAVTVVEDPAGDSGLNGEVVPGSEQGGFDIVRATVAKSGKDLVFTVEHSAMPQTKSLPEGFRFLWHFQIDREEYRFTVKSFDVGKPDVIAQSGTDRIGQVYPDGVYRLEKCSETPAPALLTLVNCNVIDLLEGQWDPAAKTVSWKLPLALVKATAGSVLEGGTTGAASSGCQLCWVPHPAERSLTPSTIIDAAVQTARFKIPKR